MVFVEVALHIKVRISFVVGFVVGAAVLLG